MSVIWKEILVISGKITDIFCFSFDFILEIPNFVAIPIRISGFLWERYDELKHLRYYSKGKIANFYKTGIIDNECLHSCCTLFCKEEVYLTA